MLRSFLQKLKSYDETLSYNLFKNVPKTKKWKSTLKFFEISCNGVIWLSLSAILTYLSENEFYLILLTGLILDIIYVSLLKAFVRRRRPVYTCQTDQAFLILSDINSFPSGHASRAIYLAFLLNNNSNNLFFIIIFWIWALCVTGSRVLLGRHYLLDVICGFILGYFEYFTQNNLQFIFTFILKNSFSSKNDIDDAEFE